MASDLQKHAQPRFTRLSVPAMATLLSAGLLLMVGGLQILRSRDVALDNAKLNAQNLSRSLAQHAARTIESVDLVLYHIVGRLEGDADRAGLRHLLEDEDKVLGQTRNLIVTDASGVWTHQASPLQTAASIADRHYFGWHRDHRDHVLHLDPMVLSRNGNRPIMPITRRYDTADGSFGGVVIGALDLDKLKTFYDTLDVGAQGAIALWTEDGRLVQRKPAIAEGIASDYRSAKLVEVRKKVASGVYLAVSPIDGIERITAFESVDRYPQLTVTASLSLAEVMALWRHDAFIQGLVLGVAALSLIGIAFALELRIRQAAQSAVELARSEALHRLLTEKASDVIAIKPTFDGIRSYVSPSSRNVLGWEPNELAVMPVVDYVHPDDQARVRAENEALTEANPEITSVHRVRHKDGRWVWIEALFQRTTGPDGPCVIATARDVSERRQAEEALAASEARYRLLAETATDMIVLTDMGGVRRYVSPASLDLLGFRPEELTGVKPDGIIHPEDASAFKTTVAKLLSGIADRAESTHRMRRKDETFIWVEAKIRVIRDAQTGDVSNLMVAVRDVSERKARADDLKSAKEAAEAATIAKSEFLARMSHELRTPLNSVIGFSNLMLEDDVALPTMRRYTRHIRDASTTLLSVVSDVLDVSKIEAGGFELDPHPFSIRAAVESSSVMLREQAKAKGLDLIVDIDARLPEILIGDGVRLRQILLNLLSNAVKFTAKGFVRIAVTFEEAPDGFAKVRCAVTDSGIGIPSDKRHRLFERFSQIDGSIARHFGGTGLGLSICQSLVAMMGGTIDVVSVEGEGSTFFFDLLLEIAEDAASGTIVQTERNPVSLGKRILVAEDFPMNQELIQAMLTKWGHSVDIVADGAAAIDAVLEKRHDIVLMDVQMPVMDGIEATRRIRALGGAFALLPIVAMTANVRREDVERCLAAGAMGHIGKPFKPQELKLWIERLTDSGSDKDMVYDGRPGASRMSA